MSQTNPLELLGKLRAQHLDEQRDSRNQIERKACEIAIDPSIVPEELEIGLPGSFNISDEQADLLRDVARGKVHPDDLRGVNGFAFGLMIDLRGVAADTLALESGTITEPSAWERAISLVVACAREAELTEAAIDDVVARYSCGARSEDSQPVVREINRIAAECPQVVAEIRELAGVDVHDDPFAEYGDEALLTARGGSDVIGLNERDHDAYRKRLMRRRRTDVDCAIQDKDDGPTLFTVKTHRDVWSKMSTKRPRRK